MNTSVHTESKPQVCASCGIPFVEGQGFIGKHIFPCANDRYGWNFVVDAPPTDEENVHVG